MSLANALVDDAPEDKGRGTDTVLGHLSLGEIVIPRVLQDGPNFELLKRMFEESGIDIAEFTVGDEANKINPETGYPEFGFFKKLKKIVKKILPIAAPILGSLFLPGLGTALGLTGLTEAGAATTLGGTLGGGIGGAAGGALSGGGLKGALLGGVTGATGGYLGNGGASDLFGGTALGNSFGLANPEGGSTFGNLLGSSASSPNTLGSITGLNNLSSSLGFGGGGSSSYAPGQIAAGELGSNPQLAAGTNFAPELGGSGLSGALGIGSGGASGYSGFGSLLGGLNSLSANDDAQDDLEKANRDALGQLAPYQATGGAANTRLSELLGIGGNSAADGYGSLAQPFTADGLQDDPGYKFSLQQGEQALGRQQAAKGNYFSGQALKDSQEFGVGLADQTYKDAFARNLAQNQNTYNMYAGQSGQGFNAASGAAGINQQTGVNKANAGISSANIINQSLSSLLGSGAKKLVGYTQSGQPIYV